MSIDQSAEINELAAALAKAQALIPPAPKSSKVDVKSAKGSYSYKFADLAEVWDSCRGPLSSNGLAVTQIPEPNELGILLRTTLMHSSGQWISGVIPLLFEGGSMQSLGSAITFARRYALSAMVGIVCEPDDDGAGASANASSDHQSDRGRRPAPVPEGRPSQANPPYANGGERPGRDHHEGRRPADDRLPVSGSQLFGWLKDKGKEREVDLLKYLSNWGKLNDFPNIMKQWDDDQVQLGLKEALRKLDSLAPAARGDAWEPALSN